MWPSIALALSKQPERTRRKQWPKQNVRVARSFEGAAATPAPASTWHVQTLQAQRKTEEPARNAEELEADCPIHSKSVIVD